MRTSSMKYSGADPFRENNDHDQKITESRCGQSDGPVVRHKSEGPRFCPRRVLEKQFRAGERNAAAGGSLCV